MFEKLLDCYMELRQWMEAVQAVVHAFTVLDVDLKYLAYMWTKLKKEASTNDAIFQSMYVHN